MERSSSWWRCSRDARSCTSSFEGPLDFDRLHPRLARRSRLVEKLLRPKQQLRDGEVLRGDYVPPILLSHELLLDGSQLFSEQVDMTLQALRDVRPSRLPNPLTSRGRLVPSFAAVRR
jgi:hypothetical protein